MITPLDIQNKEFPKGVRGYREEEVDMFLDLITLDIEKLIKENKTLKVHLETMEEELKRYKSAEGEVVKVLKQAQNLMGDISVSAEKRAEILLKNAELDAEFIVREAKDKAERLKADNDSLEKGYLKFKGKYQELLQDELKRFEGINEDFTISLDDNRLEELLSMPIPNKNDGLGDMNSDMSKTTVIKPKKEEK